MLSALEFHSRKPSEGVTTRGSHGCSPPSECRSPSQPSSNDGGATLWANGQFTHKGINFRTSMEPFPQSGKEQCTLGENSDDTSAELTSRERTRLHRIMDSKGVKSQENRTEFVFEFETVACTSTSLSEKHEKKNPKQSKMFPIPVGPNTELRARLHVGLVCLTSPGPRPPPGV